MNIPVPKIEHRGSPVVRRWSEQRWLLDNIICANGIDWDQPRSIYLNAPCGVEANADFAAIRARVQKLADIGPAFAAVARRREARAAEAEVAGHAVTARSEIDAARIGIAGQSFGSFFATIVAGSEPRLAACAVTATCLEPGCHTIFEEASPTFKKRFMYMSGYTDEAAFDEFAQTLTWEDRVDHIRCPYHCIAGEAEELSPLEHTERFMQRLQSPKRLVVYAEARHAVGGVSSTNLGPFPPVLSADWMADCLAGKPFPSERWYIETTGRIVATAY